MSRTYREFGDLLNAYNNADNEWMPIQKAYELLDSVNENEIWEQRHAAADALFKYIAELEAAQRWIPVSERLPEDGETVFVIIHDGFERFEKGNEVARLTYLGNGNWWSWESERYVVTHWMPLPQPPEVQE